jgi:tetratricopeptide (TPR) repeat protein
MILWDASALSPSCIGVLSVLELTFACTVAPAHDPHKAELILESFVMINGKPTLNVAQSMEMARRNFSAGKLGDAAMISSRVLAIEPKNPDALHLLGVIAYMTDKQDDAIQFLTDAIRVNKKYAPMHGNLALAKLAKGDLNGAASSARKALALTPSYADGHRVLGLVHQKKGRFREAIQEFQRAKGLGLNTADLEQHLATAREQFSDSLTAKEMEAAKGLPAGKASGSR